MPKHKSKDYKLTAVVMMKMIIINMLTYEAFLVSNFTLI